jgi:hypothetical protein
VNYNLSLLYTKTGILINCKRAASLAAVGSSEEGILAIGVDLAALKESAASFGLPMGD